MLCSALRQVKLMGHLQKGRQWLYGGKDADWHKAFLYIPGREATGIMVRRMLMRAVENPA